MRLSLALIVGLAGCSDRPLAVPLVPMTAPLDAITRACMTAASCDLEQQFPSLSFAGSISTCLDNWQGIERPDVQLKSRMNAQAIDCLSHAGSDCARAAGCIESSGPPCAFGQVNGPQPSKIDTSCNGDVVLQCNGSNYVPFDCTTLGMKCISFKTYLPGAAEGQCGFGTCDSTTHSEAQQCFGDRLAACEAGLWRLQDDCAAYGGMCSFDGTALCRGTGVACDGSAPPRCDGNNAVSCLGGGTVTLDCTVAGQVCLGGGCVIKSPCPAPSCQGSVLTTCGPGGPTTLDCAALGFGGCIVTSTGDRCTP